jgi:hypothetical protein
MAHIRTHQPIRHDIHTNDRQVQIRPAAGVDPAVRQAKPASNNQTPVSDRVASSPPPKEEGLRIAGFPWQFVVVISVVGLTVLAFIIKMVIGF